MEVYQNNLKKLVDSLTDEQVFSLGPELEDPQSLNHLRQLLLERLRSWSSSDRERIRISSRIYFDLIEKT